MNENVRERAVKAWQAYVLACVLMFFGILLLVPTLAFADEENDANLQSSLQSAYRLYNPYSGDHLWTLSWDEYDYLGSIGWKKESTDWTVTTNGTPVYRLFNPYTGDHHYTVSKDEYTYLDGIGWSGEDVAWYAPTSGVPVWRLYNPYSGDHHYTTSKTEYDHCGSVGWKKEDVAWYGVQHDHTWKTTHHDALTHQEAIYESKNHYICSFCGLDLIHEGDEKYETVKDQHVFFLSIDRERFSCGHSSVYEYKTVKEYKTVVDRQAYDEKRCTGCGAIGGDSTVPSGGRVWTVKIESGAAPMPEFYVEDGHKLTENTQKFNNKVKWTDATFRAKGSDGQYHNYSEGMTDAGKHQPYMIFRWSWIFKGYYTDKDCTKVFDFNTPITKDMTLYVKWLDDGDGSGSITIGKKVYEHYRFGNTMWRYITCNGKTQKMIISEGFGEKMRLINGAQYNGVEYNKKAQVNIIEFGETEDTIIPWQDYPDE